MCVCVVCMYVCVCVCICVCVCVCLCEGLSARVIVGQEFTASIGVCNRLCQGYTMASVLFNLFFIAVVDDRKRKCSTSKVEFRYKVNVVITWQETGPQSLRYYLMLPLNHSFLMTVPCLPPQRKVYNCSSVFCGCCKYVVGVLQLA